MSRQTMGFGLLLLVAAIVLLWSVRRQQPAAQLPKVGVLVPVQHEAMKQIVSGFRKQLQAAFGDNIQIDVKNAQGDVAIQRALLVQFAQGGYQAVAVVGTTASVIALQVFASSLSAATAAVTPLVALDVTADLKQDLGEVTGTLEAGVEGTLQYIHHAFPQVHMLSLVYTAEDKSYKQAKQFVRKARGLGLVVQELMVQQPADLYTVGGLVSGRSQMIVVLKDHMVASGIAPLVQRAAQQRIALLACDDGTVKSGAALAVGVAQEDIGRRAAELTTQILRGQKASRLAMRPLTEQVLFVNQAAAQQQAVDVDQAVQAAQQMGYRVQYVPTKGEHKRDQTKEPAAQP